MSKAQPKTKAEYLFDQIKGLSLDDRKSEFTLKRLAKEAQSLASIDRSASDWCMGVLSAYENKPDDAMRLFTNAIKISQGDSILLQNYSVILSQMGFFKESLQYADKAYRLNKSNLKNLETALFANIVNGEFDATQELLSAASKMRFDSERITSANEILEFVRANSISPSEFLKLQDVAYSSLHSNNIFIMKPSLKICEDEDSMFVSYQILLDKPVMEIVDLSVMLAEALAQTPHLNDISDKINISFSPWCD